MSTNSDNAARLNVPEELRELLLDFTIGYLLEQPNNLIDYGIEFFEKLKNTKSSSSIKQQSAGDFSDEDDASDIGMLCPVLFLMVFLIFSLDKIMNRLGREQVTNTL